MDKVDAITAEHFLKHIWAFELLEPQQVKQLAGLVRSRRLNRDEVLWLQGQQITYFTIIFSGQLRSVRRSSAGGEKLVSMLMPGHHFGLAEMITGAEGATTIIADEPSMVLIMDQKSLRQELLSNADICYRLMQTMARSIFKLTGELERVSFENVRTRLARLLLKTARLQTAGQAIGSDNLTCRISHEELAVQIGVSRETVSRVLADFKYDGVINTAYRVITLIDPGTLRDMIYEED